MKVIILKFWIGRWLFKFLVCDALMYVVSKKEGTIETINFAILINNIEEVAISQIIEIAKRVKSLRIITPKVNKFLYLEEKLYIEYGIAVQITNNKTKALLNAEIVVNFDFDEERINQYVFMPSATIINIKKQTNINDTNFRGSVINNYKIECDEEILEGIEGKSNFDSNILYESLIYRKDTFYHIRKQLEEDKVELLELN